MELLACRRQQVRFPKVSKRWHLRWVYLGPKQEGLRVFRLTLLHAASCHPTVVLPLSQGSNDHPPTCLRPGLLYAEPLHPGVWVLSCWHMVLHLRTLRYSPSSSWLGSSAPATLQQASLSSGAAAPAVWLLLIVHWARLETDSNQS